MEISEVLNQRRALWMRRAHFDKIMSYVQNLASVNDLEGEISWARGAATIPFYWIKKKPYGQQ